MKYKNILTPLLLIWASQLVAEEKQSTQTEQAIKLLKIACVTSGSSFELKAQGEASVSLKNLLGTGIEGAVTLTKKELEGFADAASTLSAQQASEMRNCMKPYIDQILKATLSGYQSSADRSLTIATEGRYFEAAEFDEVIITAANHPEKRWETKTLSFTFLNYRHYYKPL